MKIVTLYRSCFDNSWSFVKFLTSKFTDQNIQYFELSVLPRCTTSFHRALKGDPLVLLPSSSLFESKTCVDRILKANPNIDTVCYNSREEDDLQRFSASCQYPTTNDGNIYPFVILHNKNSDLLSSRLRFLFSGLTVFQCSTSSQYYRVNDFIDTVSKGELTDYDIKDLSTPSKHQKYYLSIYYSIRWSQEVNRMDVTAFASTDNFINFLNSKIKYEMKDFYSFD